MTHLAFAMRQKLLQALIAGAFLAPGLGVAASTPATSISLREYLIKRIDKVQTNSTVSCTSRYPSLKPAYTEAIATYLRRYTIVLDKLLKTDQFKSLALETAPQWMADSLTDSSDTSIRGTESYLPEEWCRGRIGFLRDITEDKFRDEIITPELESMTSEIAYDKSIKEIKRPTSR